MQELADHENPWTVFVETINPDTELDSLPPFDKEGTCQSVSATATVGRIFFIQFLNSTVVSHSQVCQVVPHIPRHWLITYRQTESVYLTQVQCVSTMIVKYDPIAITIERKFSICPCT